MRLLFASIVFAVAYLKTEGLSYGESHHFHNSGKYGGKVSVHRAGTTVTVTSNGLPDHPTQRVNPNTPTEQNYHFAFSTHPKEASTPGCVPMGIIGLARTGVAIYNPLDADGENAVEGSGRERFDSCDGHPDQHGVYHYHKIPDSCLYQGKEDEFIGVALDGFPIYGPRASDLGRDITNKELDKCHGRMFNGTYRYHVNNEFPYFLGCFKGTLASGHAAHRTQYTCNTDTSKYSAEWGYVCSCALPGQGGHQPMQHNPFQQHVFPNQQHNRMSTSHPQTHRHHTSKPHTHPPHRQHESTTKPHTHHPHSHTSKPHTHQTHTPRPHTSNPHTQQPHRQHDRTTRSHTHHPHKSTTDQHNQNGPLMGTGHPIMPHRPFDPLHRPLDPQHRPLEHRPRPLDIFGRK